MPRLKTVIKALFASLVLFLTIVFALLVWIFAYPQEAWNLANRYFLPADLKITWESLDFRSEKISFFHRNILWEMKGLTVLKKDPEIQIQAQQVGLKFSLHLFQKGEWLDVETLQLHLREKSVLKIPPSTEPSVEESIYQQVQGYLGYLSHGNRFAVVNDLNIQVPDFQLYTDPQTLWVIQTHLQKTTEKPNQLNLDFKLSQASLALTVTGVIEPQKLETNDNFIKSQITLQSEGWDLQSSLNGTYEGERITFEGSPEIRMGKPSQRMVVQSDLKLVLTEDQGQLTLNSQLKGIPGPIIKLQDLKTSVRMPMENDVAWSSEPTYLQIGGPVDLFLIDKDMRKPFEKACRCKMPESFQAQLQGQLWMRNFMSDADEKQKILEARFSLESIQNKLFSADVAAGLVIFREQQKYLFEPSTDTHIQIFSYQGLREFLDSKDILIPAPLNVLEGTLEFTAKAPVSQKEDRIETQAILIADLNSPHQKVQAALNATLDLSKALDSLKVQIDVLLKTLKLELPPMDPILGLPPVMRDARFLKKPLPPKAKSKFKVEVFSRIRTESPGAIQLLSSIAKPYVPMTLDIQAMNEKPPQAWIQLEPFTISYLRRNVYVEKLKLQMKGEGENSMPIDGRMRIEQGGYKIYINLAGTTDTPAMNLTSDPYLPESDIISVLLYGRVSENLVSSEAETAGSVNAAMADRAIGIFGLWAFAVTPIQSFSYNPITKVYTATVKLGSGLTAGVGTNWEQATNLELRKQISSRWVLTASWSETTNKERGEKLVLRWERRF